MEYDDQASFDLPTRTKSGIRRLSKPIRRMTMQFGSSIRSILKKRTESGDEAETGNIESLDSIPFDHQKSVNFAPVQLALHESHINFGSFGVYLPPEGVIQTLIARGQYALGESNTIQTTYSFKGWKIEEENFFLVQGQNLVCLGLTQDRQWIVEATCRDLYRHDDGQKLHGVLTQLVRLLPTKRTTSRVDHSAGDKVVLSLTLENEPEVKFEALSPSFDPSRWTEPVDEPVGSLSEMKIEIILNNFNQHVMDHSTCIFMPSEKEPIPPTPPESIQYTYRNVLNAF